MTQIDFNKDILIKSFNIPTLIYSLNRHKPFIMYSFNLDSYVCYNYLNYRSSIILNNKRNNNNNNKTIKHKLLNYNKENYDKLNYRNFFKVTEATQIYNSVNKIKEDTFSKSNVNMNIDRHNSFYIVNKKEYIDEYNSRITGNKFIAFNVIHYYEFNDNTKYNNLLLEYTLNNCNDKLNKDIETNFKYKYESYNILDNKHLLNSIDFIIYIEIQNESTINDLYKSVNNILVSLFILHSNSNNAYNFIILDNNNNIINKNNISIVENSTLLNTYYKIFINNNNNNCFAKLSNNINKDKVNINNNHFYKPSNFTFKNNVESSTSIKNYQNEIIEYNTINNNDLIENNDISFGNSNNNDNIIKHTSMLDINNKSISSKNKLNSNSNNNNNSSNNISILNKSNTFELDFRCKCYIPCLLTILNLNISIKLLEKYNIIQLREFYKTTISTSQLVQNNKTKRQISKNLTISNFFGKIEFLEDIDYSDIDYLNYAININFGIIKLCTFSDLDYSKYSIKKIKDYLSKNIKNDDSIMLDEDNEDIPFNKMFNYNKNKNSDIVYDELNKKAKLTINVDIVGKVYNTTSDLFIEHFKKIISKNYNIDENSIEQNINNNEISFVLNNFF